MIPTSGIQPVIYVCYALIVIVMPALHMGRQMSVQSVKPGMLNIQGIACHAQMPFAKLAQ
jgi:hypothetical protein